MPYLEGKACWEALQWISAQVPWMGHRLVPQLRGKLRKQVNDMFTSAVWWAVQRGRGLGRWMLVGSLEHLTYFPDVWFSKYLIRPLTIKSKNPTNPTLLAQFVSSLAWKLLLDLEVLVLASDTSSHDTISCHFAVLPRNNENQCCHSAGGLTSDPNACFSLLTVSLNSCLLTTSLSPQLHPHQYSQFCLQAGGRVTHGNLVESTLAGSSSTWSGSFFSPLT